MVATATTLVSSVHSGQWSGSPPGPGVASGSWGLVRAVQGGDREAFGQLYRRYAAGVSQLVHSRTGDRELTEDLTGETFARALKSIDSVSDQGRDVGAWLCTIARNLVTDHFKCSRSRLDQLTADVGDQGRLLFADQTRSPEQVVIARESAQRLGRHLSCLPADQRVCLQQRFTEGLSVAETAAVMGRSDGAVKALQHRGITGLRASLAAEDAFWSQRPAAGDPLVRARVAVAAAEQRAADQARPRRIVQSPALECGGERVTALEDATGLIEEVA